MASFFGVLVPLKKKRRGSQHDRTVLTNILTFSVKLKAIASAQITNLAFIFGEKVRRGTIDVSV